MTTGQLP